MVVACVAQRGALLCWTAPAGRRCLRRAATPHSEVLVLELLRRDGAAREVRWTSGLVQIGTDAVTTGCSAAQSLQYAAAAELVC